MGVRVMASGLREFSRFTRDFPKALEREEQSLLREEARALCVELGAATLPGPGFSEGNAEAFRRRVRAEVAQVFVTKRDRVLIYRLIERRSKRLAAAFLRASDEGREDQVRKIMREAGVVIGPLDPAVHKAARTGPQARVPKGYSSTAVVQINVQRRYQREQAEKVGLAKAAWFLAAKGVGGRVRRGAETERGTRTSVQIFPHWVRKVARKFPAAGGAFVGKNRVTVFSNVSYARDAIPQKLLDRALWVAEERFAFALQVAATKVRRGRYRARA